jgi:5-carboxymethyl-2-hydroxymuconate isomerase
MPHLLVLYTRDLDALTDMDALCRTLADAMLSVKDDAGKAVFPTGGTRVLAYPAAHSAVADGQRDYTFMYLNLRMGRGRSAAVHQRLGDTVSAAAKAFLAPVFANRYIGLTLQIDEGAEVYDAKHSTIHPLFSPP